MTRTFDQYRHRAALTQDVLSEFLRKDMDRVIEKVKTRVLGEATEQIDKEIRAHADQMAERISYSVDPEGAITIRIK